LNNQLSRDMLLLGQSWERSFCWLWLSLVMQIILRGLFWE
jgi:hypothetical protein